MSTNETHLRNVQLDKLNEELNGSLERCQDLVDDYRSKLAANSNEPISLEDDKEG